jgi:hypothetical protein
MPHCWGAEGRTGTKRSRTPLVPQHPEGSCDLGSAAVVVGPDLVAAGAGWTARRRGSCHLYPWQRSYSTPQDGGQPRRHRENMTGSFT